MTGSGKIKKYDKYINARVNNDIYKWYNDTAKDRKIKISKLIREIPTIIRSLERSLDEKDDKILALEEIINTLT